MLDKILDASIDKAFINSEAVCDHELFVNEKKKNNKKKIQQNNIFILVGSFYLESSAEFLKGRIIKEISDYDRKKLIIKRKNSKEIEVISGPYKSVNLLKNDYIKLRKIGFEEMDIFIND